jgi:hypothetical protein
MDGRNRDYGRGDPLRWPRDTLYQLKLTLTSPTGCGRSVGIIRLRTKTTEFFLWGGEDTLTANIILSSFAQQKRDHECEL